MASIAFRAVRQRSALCRREALGSCIRHYATELPRPPPSTSEPVVETYSATSKPRPYYAKHPPYRELPKIKSKWPVAISALTIAVLGWSGFMAYVTNQEKLSSSVSRSILRAVREDPQLRQVLGEVIRPQPEWWLNGDPWISGHINQLQGNIDVSFRIRGSRSSGTIYFTSIRKEKGVPFTVLRFKVICDDGTIVHISDNLTI
ncbi:uncharacterized protein LACBIDRAFT_191598 [Laccaria bicolor S238N-H82]|uniref:Predicted protein n=1 Tax=Laccaria bicolor (strain S238N-H82 / ATCC MYA-4686) TaxID=486041 RepID=B0DQ95_LACBS|nr:uncharacterized protein LACBIDRAFT_191598 [Laccaria bicolor S238N-H82]EDR03343.1 predicted protein [Laccaria bicolor S238N-H82]|eukprot:XP_001886139.1 predicted protein [Laccaria bicolor S238N-H82]